MSARVRLAGYSRALAWLASGTGLAVVIAAAAPGLARALRAWFAFAPGPRSAAPSDAFAIWLTNLRVLGLLLLAALAARERGLVPGLDVIVTLAVGANVALVGFALGAYGAPLLPWLVHVPVEWAGLSVGLGAYLSARHHAPGLLRLASAGVVGAALLALAASVEVWATPRALP